MKSRMKQQIKQIINNSKCLSNMVLRFSNKISGKVEVQGLHIRKNKINIFETSSLKCGEHCEIQNNIITAQGKNNEILFGNRVQFLGGGQASILVFGNNNKIQVEDDCRIMCTQFFIRGDNNIICIGKNCSATYTCFHIESDQFKVQNTIELGDGTTIHGRNEKQVEFFLDEGTKVKIHSDCMLANNISIKTTDSHSVLDKSGNRINPAKDVEIGKHCWIGEGAKILKGVKIAENNVVAAGSICTHDFDKAGTIIAGVPAKVVKEDVNWCRKQI